MNKNYTIKDIAKALNLSPSTVSRALRDSHEISQKTKKLVLDFAKKINYRTNPIALSLKERKSYSIGIIVSEFANNFFSQVIDGVESVANANNYQVVISQTHESAQREEQNIEYFYSRAIDGILISLSAETSDLSYMQSLIDKGYPLVFFDRVPSSLKGHKVISDNRNGSIEAVHYLAKKGKKKIAHLTGSKSLFITNERVKGYKMGLMANGLEYSESLVKHCEYGGLHHQEVEKAVDELLREDIDAVFISGDKLTTGFLQILREKEDFDQDKILVAGFTNSNVVNLFSPKIISVRQSAFEMGKNAVELLIEQINSKEESLSFKTITVPTVLSKK